MNSQRTEQILADLDEWQRVQRPHELMRFAPVVALSTAGGCAVVALCLWTVLPDALWPLWLGVGVAVSLMQWWSQRYIGPSHSAAADPLGRRRWILVNALTAGVFWGFTTYLLFPFESVEHQLLLAFILMAVTALWLPLFALSPVALLAFTVPGLLPMAFGLLTAPEAPQAT